MSRRWNPQREGQQLAKLFQTGDADPTAISAAEIDPIQALRPDFQDHQKGNFRNNYKKTGRRYLRGLQKNGARRCELS